MVNDNSYASKLIYYCSADDSVKDDLWDQYMEDVEEFSIETADEKLENAIEDMK